MKTELVLVPENQKNLFSVILDEYLQEHCSFQNPRVGPETAAEYRYFPEYWREEGRYPFYIMEGAQTLGFVLIRTVFQGEDFFYQVSEFYIKPENRRKGFGKGVVSELWKRYPGQWELQVLAKNHGAYKFWSACSQEFSVGPVAIGEFEEQDGKRYQFNFEVPNAS